ncbi:non-ribosomal peptide synthase/amino acid adenylation enzyme [Photorhabdus aegyptia]|uniref:Non-ribosomal peptide synthase/amino acid adenylation enzyme n=2 Tax=Photorhabdus aegyptia TaxID=2805098 RepID=A0A022PP58_9GAMM|nr:non-ribosomal peptide synthase/amino acid adenylation enzyme [Photorhabdus aegyptia]
MESYWKDKLVGFSELDLPLDYRRNSIINYSGDSFDFNLTEKISYKLNVLAEKYLTTPYVLLISAYFIVLSKLSGQEDILIGIPSDNRDNSQTHHLIGLFANMLALRISVDRTLNISEFIKVVHHEVVMAKINQAYPFSKLIDLLNVPRDMARHPIFQVSFDVVEQSNDIKCTNSPFEPLNISTCYSPAKFDLDLTVTINNNMISGSFIFAKSVLSKGMISSLCEMYTSVLMDILDEDVKKISDLSFMDNSEKNRLLYEWNHNKFPCLMSDNILAVFETQVQRTPDNVAVVCGEARLTYRELNTRANQLAGYLRDRGLAPQQFVALYLERSAMQIICLLAIFKVGAVYVPFDPAHSAGNLSDILAEMPASFLLTQQTLSLTGLPPAVTVIPLAAVEWGALSSYDAGDNLPVLPLPANALAYVIYTSGSTGRPKGVMVENRALCAHILAMRDTCQFTDRDRVLVFASFSVDTSLEHLLAGLLSGAEVYIKQTEWWTEAEFFTYASRHAITVTDLTPVYCRQLMHAGDEAKHYWPKTTLRLVVLGGESLPPDLVAAWKHFALFGRCALVNAYGCTEATITSACYSLGDGDDKRAVLPVGQACSVTSLYVLDERRQPVPVGVPGELYLGGVGLARGYLNQPALTAERFVPNPFATERERAEGLTRLYRTGDRVRWLPDGTLAYLGRLDSQIKLRGFRIEPGEIESLLRTVPGVADAVVQLREDHPGEKRLAAYLVAGPDLSGPALLTRCHHTLTARLPDYMHPAVWALLPALPLMPSGKLDWRALPVPAPLPQDPDGYVAPVGEAERLLCDIWQAALHLPQVGVNDNFFTLGGDSILAIQVTSRAVRAGLAVSVRQLFEHKTVRGLAAHLGAVPAVSQAALRGEIGLHPVQQRFFAETSGEYHHYNQSLRVSVPADFSLPRLTQLVTALYERHDGLRLRYWQGPEGRWSGQYDETPLALQVAASIQHLRVSGEAQVLAARAAQRSLSLEKGPLLRAVYFDEEAGGGTLLLVMHHLIVDGVSWRIVLDDMAAGYRQIVAGEAVRLAPKTSGYPQWLARLQGYAGSEALQAERGYWQDQLLVAGEGLAVDYPGAGVSLQADSEEVVIRLSAAETGQLLQPAGAAYRTRVDELLLAGVLQGFWRWRGQRGLRVWLEGHGRELLFDELDTSGTLGWFTSVYPVRLSRPAAEGLAGLIRQVKETCRAVPHHGIGYGILRYLAGDPVLAAAEAAGGPEVVFNYLGQFDGGEGGRFTPVPGETGEPVSGRHKRHHRLGLNGWVAGGRLHLVLDYSRREYERATMAGLGEAIEQGLQAVIAHCVAVGQGGYTPADFPLMRVSESQLSAWEQQYPGFEDLYPATPMQAGMLYHDQLSGESGGVYLCQTVVMLAGSPDIVRLRRAWETVVQRHAVLRTQFVADSEGSLVQMVRSSVSLPWSEADWSGLTEAEQAAASEAWCREDRARGFDVTAAPLMRIGIRACGGGRYRLLWTCHHMLLDGWSGPLVWQEIQRLYREGEGAALPLPVAYKAYIAWLGRQDREKARAFWRTALSGVEGPTPLNVARVSRGREETAAERTHTVRRVLSRRETARLHQVARRSGTTMSTLLQCAWGYLLHSYSGEETVVFGLTVSGRPAEVAGVEEMVGLLIQTVPVRMEFGEGVGLDAWLRTQQSRQAEYTEYGYLGLSEIRRQSEVSGEQGLFESLLVYENYPVDERNEQIEEALSIKGLHSYMETNYKITLQIVPEEELEIKIKYFADVIDEVYVKDMLIGMYELLIKMSYFSSDTSYRQLTMFSEKNHKNRLAIIYGENYVHEVGIGIHELFEKQVCKTPEKKAIVCGQTSISYVELNTKANFLSSNLMKIGIDKDDRVAIYMEKSIDFVISILAVLKSGASYIPIDANTPLQRIKYIIEDSRPKAFISKGNELDELHKFNLNLNKLDIDKVFSSYRGDFDAHRYENKNIFSKCSHIIYTSGTTAEPKGVMGTHESVINRITWMNRRFPVSKNRSACHITDFSFIRAVWELFAPLLHGVELHLINVNYYQFLDDFSEFLVNKNIQSIITTPTMLGEIIRMPKHVLDGFKKLSYWFISGEKFRIDIANKAINLFPKTSFVNLYGSTENMSDVCFHELDNNIKDKEVLIGKPIDNTAVAIVNRDYAPLPVGAVGEICVSGCSLALGYFSGEKRRGAKFIEGRRNLFNGERFYCTGDYGICRYDGNIEFIGRKDELIKIRGYRVSITEIENSFLSLSYIDSISAFYNKKSERISAYIILSDVNGKDSDIFLNRINVDVRDFISSRILPIDIIFCQEIPRTSNGKLDKTLFDTEHYVAIEYEPQQQPLNYIEQYLYDIWSDILEREPGNIHMTFFESGGNSISAMRMISKIYDELGVKIPMKSIFDNFTVYKLAKILSDNLKEEIEEVLKDEEIKK